MNNFLNRATSLKLTDQKASYDLMKDYENCIALTIVKIFLSSK